MGVKRLSRNSGPKSAVTARPPDGLLEAVRGFGPLLQRDYWAVVRDCRGGPADVARYVSRRFEHFAPESLVVFRRRSHPGEVLEVGDELDVHILGAGHFAVRVICADAQSFTLATMTGHPEAGRITFGAYRNGRGEVIFHIRSRARSSTRARYLGFLGVGEPMQTTVWTDFVNRVAVAVGGGVRGWIHATTARAEDEPEERARSTPTFFARGN